MNHSETFTSFIEAIGVFEDCTTYKMGSGRPKPRPTIRKVQNWCLDQKRRTIEAAEDMQNPILGLFQRNKRE
jgi:hypothetical protein